MADDMKRGAAGGAEEERADMHSGAVPGGPSARDSAGTRGQRAVPTTAFPGTDAPSGDEVACERDADAPRRMPAALAGLLALACIALVAVCIGFVRPAAGGGWSVAWLFGDADAPAADGARHPEGSGEASDGAAEGDGAKEAESGKGGDAVKEDGAAKEDGASNEATGASSGAGASSSASKGGASSGVSDSSSSTGGSASSGSSNGAAPVPKPDTVTVTVSVDSSAADGSVSGGGTFTFERGATVYDALLACGLAVGAENSAMGVYVYSIGGLAERQFGGGSGWNYAVNGSTPGYSSGAYELADGDAVSWFYVID